MADLKKILSKLKEDNQSEGSFEQLSEQEASELEGGAGNSGCPSNRGCPVNQSCPT